MLADSYKKNVNVMQGLELQSSMFSNPKIWIPKQNLYGFRCIYLANRTAVRKFIWTSSMMIALRNVAY